VALPVLVFSATGSAAATGTVAALRVVPYLLFGLLAGPLADRWDRKRIIVGTSLVQALVMAAVPLWALAGEVPVELVFAVVVVSATCFVFGDAAAFGALPTLVGVPRLAAANGLLVSAVAGVLVTGPALAGALLPVVDAATVVWVDVACSAAAGLLVAGLAVDLRPRPTALATRGIAAHARAGLRFALGHPVLRTLLAVGFAQSVAMGAVTGQLVVFAVRALGVAEDSPAVGLLFSAAAAGVLVSGLFFGRVFAPGRLAVLVPASLATSAVLATALAASAGLAAAAAALLLLSVSSQTLITTGITYRQTVAPDELQGSVNTVGRMVAWGGTPLGAAAAGAAAEVVDIRVCIAATALLLAAAAVAAGTLLPRHSRAPTDQPRPPSGTDQRS